MKILFLTAVLAGVVLPLQIAFNNKLTQFSGHPVYSSLISFGVGTVALLAYSLASQSVFQKPVNELFQAPWYAWMGGLLGAFYIVSTVVVAPKIGIALFLSIVIGGQLSMSLVIDHFGWFGAVIKPFNLVKGLGVLLVLAGILLIKK